MNEPVRLRDTGGAASALLGAGRLDVPHTARQRALVFTGVAAGMATTGTAVAAGATSLVKSVVLCVCLGTVGGGLASLAVSEALSPGAQTTQADSQPGPTPKAPSQPRTGMAPDQASEPTVAPASPVAAPTPAEPSFAPNSTHPGASTPAVATLPKHLSGASLATGTAMVAPAAAANSSGRLPQASSLFDEQRIIESARAAVSRGDAQSGLSMLDGYARSYPQGQFRSEALALRIEALSALGDRAQSRRLAAEFQQRYPRHPLLPRVQAAVAAPPATSR